MTAVLTRPKSVRREIGSEQEMCRLAATVRLAGELLEAHGFHALHRAEDWQLGPRSPNLDPNSGGWRYETIDHVDGSEEVVPVPADATGEAILHEDDLAGRRDELVYTIAVLGGAAEDAVRLLRSACPPGTVALQAEDLTPAQVAAAGHCVSCHRDEAYLEPVAMRADGSRRYRQFCRWCGEFVDAHDGRMPPLKLVEQHRLGKRISQQMVDAAVAEEDVVRKAERQEAKKARKKNRKGRS